MRHHRLQAMLMAIVAAGLAGAAAPARAETVFRSAQATVTASAFSKYTSDERTQSDETLAARRMVAETSVLAEDIPFGAAFAGIGASVDFDPDGSRAILSVGFQARARGYAGMAAGAVRYAFRYQFDVTTASRFIDDWTVTFPKSVWFSLLGPAAPAGPALPLVTAYGSHSVLLAPGSYELQLFTETDFSSTDFSVFSGGDVAAQMQAVDFYSFQIVPAPTAAVPEPASWATTLAGAALCGLAAARRRRNARHAVPGAPKT